MMRTHERATRCRAERASPDGRVVASARAESQIYVAVAHHGDNFRSRAAAQFDHDVGELNAERFKHGCNQRLHAALSNADAQPPAPQSTIVFQLREHLGVAPATLAVMFNQAEADFCQRHAPATSLEQRDAMLPLKMRHLPADDGRVDAQGVRCSMYATMNLN